MNPGSPCDGGGILPAHRPGKLPRTGITCPHSPGDNPHGALGGWKMGGLQEVWPGPMGASEGQGPHSQAQGVGWPLMGTSPEDETPSALKEARAPPPTHTCTCTRILGMDGNSQEARPFTPTLPGARVQPGDADSHQGINPLPVNLQVFTEDLLCAGDRPNCQPHNQLGNLASTG